MILYWPYIHFEEIEKNHFFEFFSSFEADFVKEFLIKWVVGDKKNNFFQKLKLLIKNPASRGP